MSETLSPDAVISKGEFAALIGVSAGRISQMIGEGKIGRDALVGEGRSARIRVDLARRQIGERRDISQALGNGLLTRLGPAPPSAETQPPAPRPDSIEEQIKREKLRSSQYANRKAAEEEEARKGRFTETAEVRQQMGRLAASMLQAFEGALAEMASDVAGQFSVPARDVEHLLRTRLRAVREDLAKRHGRRAEVVPETLDTVVTTDEESFT
jgi:hypothetical protein